jgi:NAD(P)-dependent dehydrogenase (short-subunit alcohol dehydrogenase family)
VGERLDIFVFDAGVSKVAAIEDHTVGDFNNLFATKVRRSFFLVKDLLPRSAKGRASSRSHRWPLIPPTATLGNRACRHSPPTRPRKAR